MRDQIEGGGLGESRRQDGGEQIDTRRERKNPLEVPRVGATKHSRAVGGTLAVLVVAIVAFGLAMGGHARVAAPAGAAERIKVLLAGIPQDRNTLGDPRAPVTLQYFGDLQCRVARQFTIGALPILIRRWVRGGRLKIEFLSIRSATLSSTAFRRQQVAAQAAGRQGKLWYYIEFFYHEQRQASASGVSEGYLQGLARQVPGLSVARWAGDRHDPALAERVAADQNMAARAGFSVSPSFLVKQTTGRGRVVVAKYSTVDPVPFDQAIEKMLTT